MDTAGVVSPAELEDGVRARGRLARVLDHRPMASGHRVTVHRAVGVEGPADSLGYHRAMLLVRTIGGPIMVGLAPLYATVDALVLALSVVIVLSVAAIQVATLRGTPSAELLRRLAIVGVAGDAVAVWLVGQAYIANPDWIGFIAYPIVALEAAVFFGLRAALGLMAVSIVVLGGQFVWREAHGFDVTFGSVLTIGAVFAIQAAFMGVVSTITRRVRDDLTTLLHLSALLAHQESPTRIVQALDARLREILGARVRSVGLRRPDGGYDILRWRSPEARSISPEAVAAVARVVGRDIEADFRDRRAVTLTIDPGRDGAIIGALGLPPWVRSISMVPVHSDGTQTGILPVLWDTRRVPTGGELDLLHGLADQTGLAFAQAQLRRARELAATDSLTGLANHRAFQELLAAHLRDARARHSQLAILFCDLDRFKAVNDRHGHAVGDLLLHRIAGAIRAAARSNDLVARYGGDELALILPDTGREAAIEVGRRLREAVRAVENGMGVDMTVGVGVFPDDAELQDDLLARADAAMYAGKRLGGGRVIHATDISSEP